LTGELVNFENLPRFPAGPQMPIQFMKKARAQMMEADFLGMQYLYKAGYDPNAAITFLQKIAAVEPRTTTSMLFSPVPPAAERIAAMQKNIPLILPSRSQNVITTPDFDRIKALVLT
jgi:predicted Zn-dependent protease